MSSWLRYPLTEMQCINAQLSQQHALAACKRAEEELSAMKQQTGEVLDHGKLRSVPLSSLSFSFSPSLLSHVISLMCYRHQIKLKEERLSELRSQIHELGETQLSELLQDMAAFEVSRVLHGDYDLKIARQDYFTSKQDQVGC